MSRNLPLRLDVEETLNVNRRIWSALDSSLATSQFTLDTRDPATVQHEAALAAYRWAMGKLGRVPVFEQGGVDGEFEIADGTPTPIGEEAP